jgi:hypothetical protein
VDRLTLPVQYGECGGEDAAVRFREDGAEGLQVGPDLVCGKMGGKARPGGFRRCPVGDFPAPSNKHGARRRARSRDSSVQEGQASITIDRRVSVRVNEQQLAVEPKVSGRRCVLT